MPAAQDALPLEHCDCPLCGSERHSPIRFSFPPFGVVRCSDCKLWYLNPRAPEGAAVALYQTDDYYAGTDGGGYGDYRAQEVALRLTFRRFLNRLQTAGMAGGDLLEVGCAYGFLLDEARPFFTRRAGIDFSSEALVSARPLADKVYLGNLEAVDDGSKYQTVLATQVIEHVYDPRRFVDQATRLLEPGGWLVLATPNMGSGWRRLMGRRWPSFKTPEHVTYFDRSTLGNLLTGAGLGQITEIPYPHAFPLALVAAKLGLGVPPRWAGTSLWIPATTLAMAGRKVR